MTVLSYKNVGCIFNQIIAICYHGLTVVNTTIMCENLIITLPSHVSLTDIHKGRLC